MVSEGESSKTAEQDGGWESLPKETLYQILALFGAFPFLGSVAILITRPRVKAEEGASILASIGIESWIALAVMILEAAFVALWISERLHRVPPSEESPAATRDREGT